MVLLARTSIHALLCTFQVAEMYNAQKHNHQNNQDDNDDDDWRIGFWCHFQTSFPVKTSNVVANPYHSITHWLLVFEPPCSKDCSIITTRSVPLCMLHWKAARDYFIVVVFGEKKIMCTLFEILMMYSLNLVNNSLSDMAVSIIKKKRVISRHASA